MFRKVYTKIRTACGYFRIKKFTSKTNLKNDFHSWQSQIEELAKHFELDVINNSQIFAEYKKTVQSNQVVNTVGARFHLWAERNHYYALLSALRKIFLTSSKKETSLLKIIRDLLKKHDTLTKDIYPELVGIKGRGTVAVSMAASAGAGFFDKEGRLNVKKLTQDEEFLDQLRRKQLKFVNERVLHIQKSPKAFILSDEELNKNIELMQKMLKEYRLFLTGKEVGWSVDDQRWTKIFTVPWIK